MDLGKVKICVGVPQLILGAVQGCMLIKSKDGVCVATYPEGLLYEGRRTHVDLDLAQVHGSTGFSLPRGYCRVAGRSQYHGRRCTIDRPCVPWTWAGIGLHGCTASEFRSMF